MRQEMATYGGGASTSVRKADIVVAMQPRLFERFFTSEDHERLTESGTVTFLTTPGDLRSGEALGLLSRAQVLVTGWDSGKLDDELVDQAPRLELVAHTGGTVRHVVTPRVFEHDVRVTSQTELNAVPVAEYTLAMILLSAKDVFRAGRLYRSMRSSVDRESHFPHAGVYRRRVGVIGLSMISRQVIDLLRPFGTRTMVYSRHLDEETARVWGVERASLAELLRTSEVISLHSADVPANYRMLGAEQLALIQDGATFINTARGRLVDQNALVEELATGRFDAILDVADPDVTEPESPLWNMDNVLLTPHFAGSVGNELYRLGNGTVNDIEHFLAGRLMAGEITPATFHRRA